MMCKEFRLPLTGYLTGVLPEDTSACVVHSEATDRNNPTSSACFPVNSAPTPEEQDSAQRVPPRQGGAAGPLLGADMTARLPSHHPQRSPSNNGGRGGDLPGTKRAAGGSFSKHGGGEDEGEVANFRRAPFLFHGWSGEGGRQTTAEREGWDMGERESHPLLFLWTPVKIDTAQRSTSGPS